MICAFDRVLSCYCFLYYCPVPPRTILMNLPLQHCNRWTSEWTSLSASGELYGQLAQGKWTQIQIQRQMLTFSRNLLLYIVTLTDITLAPRDAKKDPHCLPPSENVETPRQLLLFHYRETDGLAIITASIHFHLGSYTSCKRSQSLSLQREKLDAVEMFHESILSP